MKKILLLMGSMECGGVQVSLLNFLKHLQKYDVDITVMFDSLEGAWLERLPQNITVKEIPYQCEAFHKLLLPERAVNVLQNIKYHIWVHLIDDFFRKKEKRNKRYTFLMNHVDPMPEEYDIAIDYHGYGFYTTAILANKIHAKFKAAFIHDEKMDCMEAVEADLKKINAFYSVSKSCKRIFEAKYPQYAQRSFFFPNYMDRDEILAKSKESCPIQIDPKKWTIVTIGRLEWQKGYDLAVAVAQQLKKSGVPFEWLCLGDGSLRQEIQEQIDALGLKNEMILLGRVDNPYPIVKMADLYVQPSRHEGFGLAVAEALILKKIVIATNIECISEQIENGKNGILVPYDSLAFYRAISKCMNNDNLRNELTHNIEYIVAENNNFYMEQLLAH